MLPTLTILSGTGLLIAGVYRAIPAAVGMAGVAALLVGGFWALRRSGIDRRELAAAHWASIDGAGGSDVPHGHHGSGHHGGFDGGGFFDGGGGHGGGGHGGH